MPLRLFRSREVTGSNIVMALLVVGLFGLFFLGALYLQRVLGYSPLQVGLAFLPSTVVMGATSLKFSMRFAPRTIVVPAMLLIAAGMLLFMRAPVDGNFVVDILPATILIGLGAGLSTPALMTLAMYDVQPTDAGLASGLVNTTVQVGGAIGLAVLATLASERTGASQAPEALLSGYHLAFLIGAAMLGLATLVALVLLRPRERSARRSRRVLLVATCSPHTASDPSSATSCISRWVMNDDGPAPCQCSSLGAKNTVSPARIGSIGAAAALPSPAPSITWIV